jgi:DNA modification methylase
MVDFSRTGVIYCGDNLETLARLPREFVDCIYLDPPFFSNRHYEVIWGDEAEIRSFEDRWQGGIYNYVEWMGERVHEMYRVLKPNGTFFLHCDWHASHYLKAMLDGIFGEANFRNEIVWSYKRWTASKRSLPRLHDTIFFYTKGKDYFLEIPTVPNVDPNPSQYVSGKDEAGRTIVKRDAAGRTIKRTVAERIAIGDVWEIPLMSPVSKERLGYPTQKPPALLERILRMASAPDSIVLDPFAGCGTTLTVAQGLQRKWIGIDISTTACDVMKRQLKNLFGYEAVVEGLPETLDQLHALKPFEFQNWVINRINGTHSPRKTGDMGIDGFTWLVHDPVQVKQSEHIGRNYVDNFETAIERHGKTKGYIVAFSFGRGAHEEAARAKLAKGIDIELVAVSALLDGSHPLTKQAGDIFGLPPVPKRDAETLPSVQDLISRS